MAFFLYLCSEKWQNILDLCRKNEENSHLIILFIVRVRVARAGIAAYTRRADTLVARADV